MLELQQNIGNIQHFSDDSIRRARQESAKRRASDLKASADRQAALNVEIGTIRAQLAKAKKDFWASEAELRKVLATNGLQSVGVSGKPRGSIHGKSEIPTNHFCTDRYGQWPIANGCLTTLSLMVFTYRNFVADFLRELTENGRFAFLSPPPFEGLRGNIRCSSQVHWKSRSGLPISDNIKLLLMGVTAEVLQSKFD